MLARSMFDDIMPEATIWVPEGMTLVCHPRTDTPGGQLIRAILIRLPVGDELAELAKQLFARNGLRFNGECHELDLDGDDIESLSLRMKELLTLLACHPETTEEFSQLLMSRGEHN